MTFTWSEKERRRLRCMACINEDKEFVGFAHGKDIFEINDKAKERGLTTYGNIMKI